jgi:hypothetical protein
MRLSDSWGLSFSLLVILSSANSVCSQDKATTAADQASAATTYLNTAGGLQQFLEDVLSAAKSGDEQKVTAFLKAMEIPNCEAWLHEMYESDKADSWMGLCDAKTLASK